MEITSSDGPNLDVWRHGCVASERELQPRDIFKRCDVRGVDCAGVVAIFQACRQHAETQSTMENHISAALVLDGLATEYTGRTVKTIWRIMDASTTCLRMSGRGYMLSGLGHILSNVYLCLRTSCFAAKKTSTDYFMKKSVDFLSEPHSGGTGEAFLSTLHCEPSVVPGPPPPRRLRPGYAGNQLHLATRKGLAQKTAKLLKREVDVEEIDGRGYTPLCVAVHYQHPSVIRVLLDGGADVNASNGGPTAMMVSVESGNVEITSILVRAGADVNARVRGGVFPLHVAVRANNVAMVSLLVKNGADTNMPYENGATPLHVAAACGYLDVVTMFIDAGANVNVRGKGGRTALHEAANCGDGRAITALVSAGADPTLGCGGESAGVNALLSGVYHSALDAVRALATWGVTRGGAGSTSGRKKFSPFPKLFMPGVSRSGRSTLQGQNLVMKDVTDCTVCVARRYIKVVRATWVKHEGPTVFVL